MAEPTVVVPQKPASQSRILKAGLCLIALGVVQGVWAVVSAPSFDIRKDWPALFSAALTAGLGTTVALIRAAMADLVTGIPSLDKANREAQEKGATSPSPHGLPMCEPREEKETTDRDA